MATIVQGAIQNRKLYHMEDGSDCGARNVALDLQTGMMRKANVNGGGLILDI